MQWKDLCSTFKVPRGIPSVNPHSNLGEKKKTIGGKKKGKNQIVHYENAFECFQMGSTFPEPQEHVIINVMYSILFCISV